MMVCIALIGVARDTKTVLCHLIRQAGLCCKLETEIEICLSHIYMKRSDLLSPGDLGGEFPSPTFMLFVRGNGVLRAYCRGRLQYNNGRLRADIPDQWVHTRQTGCVWLCATEGCRQRR